MRGGSAALADGAGELFQGFERLLGAVVLDALGVDLGLAQVDARLLDVEFLLGDLAGGLRVSAVELVDRLFEPDLTVIELGGDLRGVAGPDADEGHDAGAD